MINLALTLIPSSIPAAEPQGRAAAQPEAEEGFLGKLALWIRTRVRYERALRALHRLDDRDLDDINIARADFPALAWRHATGSAAARRTISSWAMPQTCPGAPGAATTGSAAARGAISSWARPITPYFPDAVACS
jgi:uncharacterized protein YjiS (DUF1127 family)